MLNKLQSRSPRNAQARKQAQVDFYHRVTIAQVQKAWEENKALGDEILRFRLEAILQDWTLERLTKELLQ